MAKYVIALPLAAVAALAGCATDPNYVPPASTPIVTRAPAAQTIPFRPGTGVVESVSIAPSPMASASVGAGGVTSATGTPVTVGSSTAAGLPAPAPGMQRLGIRMSDGSLQFVDTDAREFTVGTRVELTPERFIRRL